MVSELEIECVHHLKQRVKVLGRSDPRRVAAGEKQLDF